MTYPRTDTLYITDLDGTLLGADSRVSERSRRLLNEAIRLGAQVSVATARTPATVSGLLQGLDLRLPAIVMTGAALWDIHSEQYSDVRYIDPDTAAQAIATHRHTGVPCFLYTLRDNIIHIYHPGPMSAIEAEFAAERAGNRFKQLHTGLNGQMPQRPENAVLLYTMSPDPNVPLCARMLEEEGGTVSMCYHDIFGPDVWILETFASDATKANAIATLRKRTGAARTVVFGDNVNDLSMMLAADVGVAVDNAILQVRDAADITIGPNTADAVAEFIFTDFTGTQPPILLT